MTEDDPFRPLVKPGKPGKPQLRVVASASDLTIVVPIPPDAPAAPKKHLKEGEPTQTWIYRDAEGRELGRALRFDRDGEKEFRPLTLWGKGAGEPAWRWSLWPEPRPLYGLDRLAARPSALVVVTEGEKAADAAQRLLPEFVVVTSPGGSNAASKADWSPLVKRQVVVWPDADLAGHKYAKAVAAAVERVGAASVAIVAPPPAVAVGWDAANAEAEGWTPARVDDLISAAAAVGGGAKGRRPAGEGGSSEKKAAKSARGIAAIIELVKSEGVEFWRDSAKNAYATVRVRGHCENFMVDSKAFAEWLTHTCYLAGHTPPTSGLLKDAILFFGAKAGVDGVVKAPIRRSGQRAGNVYLDLGDDGWRVVEIDVAGWRILGDHDVPIVRSASMLPLVEPEADAAKLGDLNEILNASDDGKKLIVGWMLMALAGAGPYPVLILNGEEGSAKSTISKLVRCLIDDNIAPIRALPRDEQDLLVSALHSHVLCFDNVSNIDGDTSDRLCRIATGGGMSARKKYTDKDESVFFVRNPVILNGIPSLANRPDLASRALLINLDPIAEDKRKTEREFERDWKAKAPGVLGVLLDVLSCALRRLPETKVSRFGRLADFEQFVEAAASALEWDSGEFFEAMQKLRKDSDSALVAENDVAAAIVALIDDVELAPNRRWEGTATRLLECLSPKVTPATLRSRSWPANATALGKALVRIAPVLRRQGINMEKKKDSGGRLWTIKPTAEGGESAPVENKR